MPTQEWCKILSWRFSMTCLQGLLTFALPMANVFVYIFGVTTNQIITKETQMVCGLGSRKKATYFALKLLTDIIVSQPNLHKHSARNQFTPLVLTWPVFVFFFFCFFNFHPLLNHDTYAFLSAFKWSINGHYFWLNKQRIPLSIATIRALLCSVSVW